MQAAPAAGATVIGAAGGPEKSAAVRAVGALHVVDYGDPLWPTTARDELGDRGITVVLDGVGGDIATAAMNVQVPGGRLVMFGWASGVPARLGAFDPMRLGISACVGIGPRVPPGRADFDPCSRLPSMPSHPGDGCR